MNLSNIQKPIGQLKILILLYDKKKASLKIIIKETKLNPKTATSALSNLDEIKLVQMILSEEYELTEKGEKVAKQLVNIENELSE